MEDFLALIFAPISQTKIVSENVRFFPRIGHFYWEQKEELMVGGVSLPKTKADTMCRFLFLVGNQSAERTLDT